MVLGLDLGIASPSQSQTALRTQSKTSLSSNHCVTGQVFVIEHPVNSEIGCSQLLPYSRHFSDTLDSNFLGRIIRHRNQNLNSDIGPDWRAPAAENQRAVQRNVAGEAALRLFSTVIPMENDRQAKSVSHRTSAFWGRTLGH
jgi:hypothetical protein